MIYLIPFLTAICDACRGNGGILKKYKIHFFLGSTTFGLLEWLLIAYGLFIVLGLQIDYKLVIAGLLGFLGSKSGLGTFYSMGNNETPEYASQHNLDSRWIEYTLCLIFWYNIKDRKEFIANLSQQKFKWYCRIAMSLRGLEFVLPMLIYFGYLLSDYSIVWLSMAYMILFPLAYQLPYAFTCNNHHRLSEALRGFFFGILHLLTYYLI